MELLFCGGPGLLWQTPLVAAVPHSSPFNCLLTASSSPLPESVLWTLSSDTKPLPMPADAPPAGGTRCWHSLSAQVFLCSAHHKELLCSPLILWFFFSVLPDLPTSEEAFQGVNFSSFSAPSQGHRSHSASTFIFFPIVPPSYIETFPVLSGMWGLLLIFCTCSVRIFEDVSLMYLWEEVSFLSWSCYSAILVGSPLQAVFKNQTLFQKTDSVSTCSQDGLTEIELSSHPQFEASSFLSPLQKRRQGVNSDLDCLLSVVCQHYNEIFESIRNSSYGLKISAIFSSIQIWIFSEDNVA